MNSLSYLSRQFDVLASAKTPPSTPASADGSSYFASDGRRRNSSATEKSLPRVKTWSKSLLLPPLSTPKRSHSSPAADFVTLARVASYSTRTSSTSASLDTQPLPKSNLEALIRRIFFVRVVVLAWDSLRAALASLLDLVAVRPKQMVKVEEPSVGETDEEPVDELSPPPTHPPYDVQSNTDPTPLEAKPESTLPLPPYLATHTSDPPLSAASSRASTPTLSTRKTPFHLPKTLVLDLDETLIHSTSRPIVSGGGSSFFGFGKRDKGAGHVVEVVLGGRSTTYHVYKRPFADFFLRTVSGWYTLVIFTASMQEYADPVIDWLDAGRGILSHRLFRDSCTQLPNGTYTKDLSVVQPDLARVCLIDNSPVSYRVNEANGIPIEGWMDDPYDEALLDLLPVLDSLRFTSDVRRVLGLRSAGGSASAS